MPTHPKDIDLVKKIISGDQAAADDFERKYLPRFESIARHAGVPHQDCRDIAQDVFLAGISQMQRGLFRGESSLGTWLARIVYGKIADYWRSQEHRGGISSSSSQDNTGDDIASIEKLPSRMVDYAIVLTVRQALERMPAELRLILLLNRNEGVTIEEIGKALSLTKGQVSNRLYKAEELFCQLITRVIEK
jgi:RNA polymerase sigma-70 factor (ECF subfamily)